MSNSLPFHEAIVEVLKGRVSWDDLNILSKLIKHTKIPANHAAIKAAWQQACHGYTNTIDRGVSDYLELQEREHAR